MGKGIYKSFLKYLIKYLGIKHMTIGKEKVNDHKKIDSDSPNDKN